METEAYTWRGERKKGTDGMAQRAIGDRYRAVQQQREKHRFSTTVMEVLQSLLLCMYGLRLQVFLRCFALKWILEIYIKVGFKAAVFLKNDTTN